MAGKHFFFFSFRVQRAHGAHRTAGERGGAAQKKGKERQLEMSGKDDITMNLMVSTE